MRELRLQRDGELVRGLVDDVLLNRRRRQDLRLAGDLHVICRRSQLQRLHRVGADPGRLDVERHAVGGQQALLGHRRLEGLLDLGRLGLFEADDLHRLDLGGELVAGSEHRDRKGRNHGAGGHQNRELRLHTGVSLPCLVNDR